MLALCMPVLSLQLKERQLELWSKRVEERESTQRILKDKLHSLAELIESKEAQSSQLEQEWIVCHHMPSIPSAATIFATCTTHVVFNN